MDDESGESMELMEKVSLKELGDAELERLVRRWRREAGREACLLAPALCMWMWMDERSSVTAASKTRCSFSVQIFGALATSALP